MNSSLSLAFCLVVHQPHDAGTNTFTLLCTPFLYCKIDTREMKKVIACKYPSNQYLHGCRRMAPWLLLTWTLLLFDTLRPREEDGSEAVAALWSGLWARSLLSCRKLHWSPFEHSAFFFPLVTDTFSSFNATHSLRFLTTAPLSILPWLASKFRNRSF